MIGIPPRRLPKLFFFFVRLFLKPQTQTSQKRETERVAAVWESRNQTPKLKPCVRLHRPQPWHTRNFLRHRKGPVTRSVPQRSRRGGEIKRRLSSLWEDSGSRGSHLKGEVGGGGERREGTGGGEVVWGWGRVRNLIPPRLCGEDELSVWNA